MTRAQRVRVLRVAVQKGSTADGWGYWLDGFLGYCSLRRYTSMRTLHEVGWRTISIWFTPLSLHRHPLVLLLVARGPSQGLCIAIY
jgi:hypothetical protein